MSTSVWHALESSSGGAPDGEAFWQWLRDRVDFAAYRPRCVPAIEIERLVSPAEGESFIIKNPREAKYLRLAPEERFLLELMDGEHTVRDLVLAYFKEYRRFAFERVTTLVEDLQEKGFLEDRPLRVYDTLQERLSRRGLAARARLILAGILQTELAIPGIDGVVTFIYRAGGRLFFTIPVRVIMALVSLVGFLVFLGLFFGPTQLSLLQTGGEYSPVALVMIALAQVLVILCHEGAHALTTKHFGREVRRGGFVLYFGMPAFFVDTTDIWMSRRSARLWVSWAGPYCEIVLGGLASLVLAASLAGHPAGADPTLLQDFLYKFAVFLYLGAFLNLNPLLELDGYYLLMDWLEVPLLRRRAFEFIRRDLWPKLRARLPFTRQERILAIYGLAASVYAVLALYLVYVIYQAKISTAIFSLWAEPGLFPQLVGWLLLLAVWVPLIILVAVLVYSWSRSLCRALLRSGIFDSTPNVALALVGLALLALLAAGQLPVHTQPWLATPAFLAALAITLLGRQAFAFSRWEGVARLFTAFLGLAALGSASSALLTLWPASPALRLVDQIVHAACVAPMFGMAFLTFVHSGLPAGTSLEKAAIAALIGLTPCLAFPTLHWHALRVGGGLPPLPAYALLIHIVPSVLGALAAVLLLPQLFAFFRSRFLWPSLFLAAGLLCMGLITLERSRAVLLGLRTLPSPVFEVIPALTLAAGAVLFALVYGRIRFAVRRRDRAAFDTERSRVASAFAFLAETIHARVRDVAGVRVARAVEEQFNLDCLASDSDVHLRLGRMHDEIPPDLSLLEVTARYRDALLKLVELAVQEIGDSLARRTVRAAFDALWWEEREAASAYLLGDADWEVDIKGSFTRERRVLHRRLARSPLFSEFSEAERKAIAAALVRFPVRAGQVVIRQGEPGDRCFVIWSGTVDVSVTDPDTGRDRVIATLNEGDTFGEVALLTDAPRNATCTATQSGQLLALSKVDFDRLVKGRLADLAKVDRAVGALNILHRMPLFREWSPSELRRLTSTFESRQHVPGEVIVRQGDPGHEFFIVEKGRVVVEAGDPPRTIAHLGRGEYFGEIAMLTEEPRTATVRAVEPTATWVLGRDLFERLIFENQKSRASLQTVGSRRRFDMRAKIAAAGP